MKNEMKMEIELIEGFPPIVGNSPNVLILRTFPGEESLRQKQYYAHPRNMLWEIIGQICGAGRELDYKVRLNILRNSNIALWDLLKTCSRQGSLDINIRTGFYEVNVSKNSSRNMTQKRFVSMAGRQESFSKEFR